MRSPYFAHTFRGKCHDCGIKIAVMPANDKNLHVDITRNHSKIFNHRCTVYEDTMHLQNGYLTDSDTPPVAIAIFPS